MKIIDKKQPTNTSLLPTVWIGSPDSPVGASEGATRLVPRVSNAEKSARQSDEPPIRKSA